MIIDEITASKFWSKVDRRGPDDCWPWMAGRVPYGYGAFYIKPRNYGAHVVAWMLSRPGFRIINKAQVCHRCDNPICVNPSHLFIGSAADNHIDAALKGRKPYRLRPASEHPDAMPRGSRHWATKRGPLNEANVLDIRRRLAAGERQCDIMRALGLPRRVVQRVAANRVWRHVQP